MIIDIKLTDKKDLTTNIVSKILRDKLEIIRELILHELVRTHSKEDKEEFEKNFSPENGIHFAEKIGSKKDFVIITINQALLILVRLRRLSRDYGLITFKPISKEKVDLGYEFGKELVDGSLTINKKSKTSAGQAVVNLKDLSYLLEEFEGVESLGISTKDLPSLKSSPSFKRIVTFCHPDFKIEKIKVITEEEKAVSISHPFPTDSINLEEKKLKVIFYANINENFSIITSLAHDNELLLTFQEIQGKPIINKPQESITKITKSFTESLFESGKPRLEKLNSLAKSKKLTLSFAYKTFEKQQIEIQTTPIKIDNITDFLYDLLDQETDVLISKGIGQEAIDEAIDRIEELEKRDRPEIRIENPKINQEFDLLQINQLKINLKYGEVIIRHIKIRSNDQQLFITDKNLINRELHEGENILPLEFKVQEPKYILLRGMLDFKLVEEFIKNNKSEVEIVIEYKEPPLEEKVITIPIILKNQKAFLIQAIEKSVTPNVLQAIKSELQGIGEKSTHIQTGNRKIEVKLSENESLNQEILEVKDDPKIKSLLDDIFSLYPDFEIEIEE